MNMEIASATAAVILLSFFCPSSPSSRRRSRGGSAYVRSCMMMDALMYGVIESENTVACESAPPVMIFRYSRKLPPVALSAIQPATTPVSRNGTTRAQPRRKTIIMKNVYKSFLRMSLIIQASLRVLNTLHHLCFSTKCFDLLCS